MMAASDLAELLGGAGEDLGVEYKAWLDLTDPETRAKLAKHLAALANHGGGYIVIGVDDTTRLPMGAPPPGLAKIDQEAVAGIVKRYLSPPFQIQVEMAEKDGVGYPVVIVPSHGQRPVMAIADGPTGPKGQPLGVSQGRIYVRAAGPQSIDIKTPDDWNALLDRCLSHRGDQLAKIMRQGIARPDRPRRKATELLLAAAGSAAEDFANQTVEFASLVPEPERAWVSKAGQRFSLLAYALLDADGEHIEIDGLRRLADTVATGMRRHAHNGWAAFLPLTPPASAPQLRSEQLLGEDRAYLEGMRLASSALVSGSVDYWRLYEAGIGSSSESYWEDAIIAKNGGNPYLTASQCLFRIHSVLAHARLAGQELQGVAQVMFRHDWHGLQGRMLMWDRHRFVTPGTCADDRFAKTVTLPWADLRDRYFETLRKVALPFLEVFPSAGWPPADDWLTREWVERTFAGIKNTVCLFDD